MLFFFFFFFFVLFCFVFLAACFIPVTYIYYCLHIIMIVYDICFIRDCYLTVNILYRCLLISSQYQVKKLLSLPFLFFFERCDPTVRSLLPIRGLMVWLFTECPLSAMYLVLYTIVSTSPTFMSARIAP